MAQVNPGAPPPVKRRKLHELGLVQETRTYELLTPLFGGGALPRQADEVTIVRGTEVRGHLRFWWRATRGGQFGNGSDSLKRMKQREDEIWGAAAGDGSAGPSDVIIEIVSSTSGAERHPFTVEANRNNRPTLRPHEDVAPAYAAFPLQPRREDQVIGMATDTVVANVSFQLRITYPSNLQPELEPAIWAWETFGGIGARTRRGFGALQCTHINGKEKPVPPAHLIDQLLVTQMKAYDVTGTWPHSVPHLSTDMKLKVVGTTNSLNANRAWSELIRALRDFRQQRFGHNNRGRSKWPEPDEIRRVTGRSSAGHSVPVTTAHTFPRGQIGLPIVFHFKDEKQGDPKDTTLQGADHERLASRLILRPLACKNGKAVGLAAVLVAPSVPDGGLMLKDAPGNPRVSGTVSAAVVSGISPLNGQTDVLQAFLDTL